MSEQRSENPLILTTEEAAEHVGVTPATVRRWVFRGHLEPLRRGAKPLRFHLLDVARCYADRQPKAWHDALDRAWDACIAEEKVSRSVARTTMSETSPEPQRRG